MFLYKIFFEATKLSETTLAMSSTYHQQLNCRSEVVNKCAEMYLRCFTGQIPHKWSKRLNWVEF